MTRSVFNALVKKDCSGEHNTGYQIWVGSKSCSLTSFGTSNAEPVNSTTKKTGSGRRFV